MSTAVEKLPYEIKISKTEQKVPVVEGVHLHSIYNPDREAQGFIEKNLETLEKHNRILVLGLGFGYHVNHTVQKLKQIYGHDFEVCVIEPNRQVYQDCYKYQTLIESQNVKVFCFDSVDSYYREFRLVNFLKERPGVLMHPASYNLYQDFFKQFLTYSAPRDLRHILASVDDSEVRTYLSSESSAVTLEHILSQLQNKPYIDNPIEFALLAFNEIGPSAACEDNHE